MEIRANPGVTVEVDQEAGAAHITLGAGAVARTVEFDEDIYVDLDEYGMVLGIELLDMERSLPLDELAEHHHFNTVTLAGLLRTINWGSAARAAHSSSGPTQPVSFGTVCASDTAVSAR